MITNLWIKCYENSITNIKWKLLPFRSLEWNDVKKLPAWYNRIKQFILDQLKNSAGWFIKPKFMYLN